MSLTLTLPWPPSVNGYWRAFRGRQILSKRGREFRERAMAAVLEQVPTPITPMLGDLSCRLVLFPPSHRRYDVDNYGKAVLDALVHAGLMQDDAQVRHLDITGMVKDGEGRAVVKLKEIER